MRLRHEFFLQYQRCLSTLILTVILCACAPVTPENQVRAVMAAAPAQVAGSFAGKRGDYSLMQTRVGYSVKENAKPENESVVSGEGELLFSDYRVNLSIGSLSRTIPASDLQLLMELYIAFFNRVPDADGLAYWISQYKAGQGIEQIAEHFYQAALLYSDLTGYSAQMTHADFVRMVYKNVLGRFDANAPPQEDVNYWSAALSSGQSSRGALVRVMLASAHTFQDDPTWGWVTQLLNNKHAVAQYFAVQHGLNLKTPEESITQTMAIARAVTAENFTAAMKLIDVEDKWFNLAITTTTAPSGEGAPCPSDLKTPLFDSLPIAMDDFLAFRPLGFMSVPIHMFPAKHSAFSMTPLGQTAVPKPVRAPGKVIVTEIYEAKASTGGRNYQIFMRPCGEVRAYFGHLVTISDKLLTEFNRAPAQCNSFAEGSVTMTTCRRERLSIELASGEQFGTGPDTAGVDFGVLGFRRTPEKFINLEHYDTYYPFYTSPLDYFTAGLRTQLESKTGQVFGTRMRVAAPVGGSYMLDVPGTAQGNWFLPGKHFRNTTDLSAFLGLARDYVDPNELLMSLGTGVKNATLGLYSYVPTHTGYVNRDYKDIVPDGRVYCIDSFKQGQSTGGVPLTKPAGVLLLNMPDYSSLKVEFVNAANCAASAQRFSSAASLFVR